MQTINAERLHAAMQEANLDVLIASTAENIHYATGYRPFSQQLVRAAEFLAVLPAEGRAPSALITPLGEVDRIAERQPAVDRVIPYGNFVYTPPEAETATLSEADQRLLRLAAGDARSPSAVDALVAFLQSSGLAKARIGVDEAGLAWAGIERLRESLPQAEIRTAHSTWRWIRMVKTKEEIRRLKSAIAATERAIMATLDDAQEGITEREMEATFYKTLIEQGARPAFAVIAFGSHGAFPNASCTNRELRRGDSIRYDVGCTVDGYYSDISRTAYFGSPDRKVQAYYKAILAGEEAAIAGMRPGRLAQSIFDAAVQATRRAGIPHYQRNHVGHGIGIEVYDAPTLAPGDQTALQEGMVFCVETPYYEIGWHGLQIEDTVLITSAGAELLTSLPRQLLEI